MAPAYHTPAGVIMVVARRTKKEQGWVDRRLHLLQRLSQIQRNILRDLELAIWASKARRFLRLRLVRHGLAVQLSWPLRESEHHRILQERLQHIFKYGATLE
jgi:hypothetical protein